MLIFVVRFMYFPISPESWKFWKRVVISVCVSPKAISSFLKSSISLFMESSLVFMLSRPSM